LALIHALKDIIQLVHLLGREMCLDDTSVSKFRSAIAASEWIDLLPERTWSGTLGADSPSSHFKGLNRLLSIANGTAQDFKLTDQHSRWVSTTNDLGLTLWHANADHTASKLQEAQRLSVCSVTGGTHNHRRSAKAVGGDFLDVLGQLLVPFSTTRILADVKEGLGTTLFGE
jgi:hypothetical protein